MGINHRPGNETTLIEAGVSLPRFAGKKPVRISIWASSWASKDVMIQSSPNSTDWMPVENSETVTSNHTTEFLSPNLYYRVIANSGDLTNVEATIAEAGLSGL